MNKGIRIILGISLVSILGLYSYQGYHQQQTDKQVPIDEEVVIKVWTKDRHDAAFQQEKVALYNKENKDNIRVEYKMFGENYVQAVNDALQNGEAPDLMVYKADIFNNPDNVDKFQDIAPYMSEAFKETFAEVMVEGINTFEEVCYFIPTTVSTARLFYNQSLFERVGLTRPPETMEELVEYARHITQTLGDEGIYGFAVNMNNAKSAFDRSLIKQMCMQTGIQSGFNFTTGRYDFSTYEDLLIQWRALMKEDVAYPNSAQLDIDPIRQLFAQGKIGMYISYLNAEISIYNNQFKTTQKWDYVPIPTLGGKQVAEQSCALNNGYLFSAQSEHLDEAWKVYEAIFANTDYLTEYYMQGYGTSIVPEVVLQAKQKGYEIQEPIFNIQETQHVWPTVPHEMHPEAIKIEGVDMYETFKELIFNEAPLNMTLDALSRRYNIAYQRACEDNQMLASQKVK